MKGTSATINELNLGYLCFEPEILILREAKSLPQ